MGKRIGAKADVSRIQATGTRFDLSDAIVGGLRLRVWPTGAKTWSLIYRDSGGKQTRLNLGNFPGLSLADARKLALTKKAAIVGGEDPQGEKRRKRAAAKVAVPDAGTVGATCEAYLATRGEDIRPTTAREWLRLAARIGAHFGKLPVRDLDRLAVREWLRKLRTAKHPTLKDSRGNATGVKGYSANRGLEFLRLALEWATEEGAIPANPAAGIKRPSKRFKKNNDILAKEEKRARALSVGELRAVLLALDQIENEAHRPGEGGATADALRLALLTGKRRSGVLGFSRSEIEGLDGPGPLWSLPAEREKNATAHRVPLSPAAVAIIRRRLAECEKRAGEARAEARTVGAKPHPSIGEFLFATHRDPRALAEPWWSRPEHAQQWFPQKFIRRVKERATKIHGSMKPWTPHALRATFASRLAEDLRVELTLVSLMMNHAVDNESSRLGYVTGERLDERRAALVAWAAWLDELRAGEKEEDDAGDESQPAKVLPMRRRAS